MRILLAVHHYPPRYKGGSEDEARRYARALIARGHDVRVVCVERIDQGPADGLEWSDETYEGVPLRRLSFDLRRAPDRFVWEYDNPWVADHLRRLIDETRPELFHLIGGYLISGSALRVAREAGIPSIVRATDFWFLCPRITMQRSDGTLSRLPIDVATCARCLGEEQRRYRIPGQLVPAAAKVFWQLRRGRGSRIRRRLDFLHESLRGVAAILSPSQFLRNVYVDAGVDPARIHFMRQGVEVPAGERRTPSRGVLRLGFIGQIAPLKGADVVVRALRRLSRPDVGLAMYGDLGALPKYGAEIRRLAEGDPRIELRGVYQEWGGLTAVLREIDALVVPSTWFENSPTVILEAFAHGVPVIASDLGGMAELVRHEESGLLFPPGDVEALRRSIERLAVEPGLLDLLASGVPPVKTVAEEISEYEGWCARVLAAAHASRLEARA